MVVRESAPQVFMGSGLSPSASPGMTELNAFVIARDWREPHIVASTKKDFRRDHDDETHCRPWGRGRRGRGRAVEAVRRRVGGGAGQDLPGLASRRGVEEEALARAVLRAAPARHRARRHEPARSREAPRHLHLRRLRPGPLRLGDEVRLRHRLAELLPAARGQGRDLGGQHLLHAPHRGALRELRRPSRPRLRGRAEADRPALLHERHRHEVPPGRGSGVMTRLALLLAALAAALGLSLAAADEPTKRAEPPGPGLAVATFAAGCFWCVEPPYDKTEGVVSTTSGYTGGKVAGATYRQVGMGGTGHTEAVRVVYDPAKVGYDKLLEVYWKNVDPLDAKGQFCDKGEPYRPAIFVHDEEQRRLAEASKAALAASGRFKQPIVVAIEPASDFWIAEDYHQDYYLKNPAKYAYYRWGCGRDARLEELWGKKEGS